MGRLVAIKAGYAAELLGQLHCLERISGQLPCRDAITRGAGCLPRYAPRGVAVDVGAARSRLPLRQDKARHAKPDTRIPPSSW
jgi:hypothetical protein